jgi:hypothetical protein
MLKREAVQTKDRLMKIRKECLPARSLEEGTQTTVTRDEVGSEQDPDLPAIDIPHPPSIPSLPVLPPQSARLKASIINPSPKTACAVSVMPPSSFSLAQIAQDDCAVSQKGMPMLDAKVAQLPRGRTSPVSVRKAGRVTPDRSVAEARSPMRGPRQRDGCGEFRAAEAKSRGSLGRSLKGMICNIKSEIF